MVCGHEHAYAYHFARRTGRPTMDARGSTRVRDTRPGGARAPPDRGTDAPGPASPGASPVTDLSPSQLQAVDTVVELIESGRSVVKLFGYAGTGKTTVAREIATSLPVPRDPDRIGVQFAAYTGKATHVLRQKGCHNARTIHSLIYEEVDTREEIKTLSSLLIEAQIKKDHEKQSLLINEINRLKSHKGPRFRLRDKSDLSNTGCLILDECSMISDEVLEDLLSFGVPIIALGDPAQLPPVEGVGSLIKETPDFLLTEVHRQSGRSPILSMATRVREGGWLRPEERAGPLAVTHLLSVDQVIVGTKASRWQITSAMRLALGRNPVLPQPGDRIMCLRNNKNLGVLNGAQYLVLDIDFVPDRTDIVRLTVTDPAEYRARELSAYMAGFLDQEGQDWATRHGGHVTAAFTWSEAITCHKAQGSEWGSVAILDQSYCFKPRKPDEPDNSARWMYTALTRASDQMYVTDRILT